MAKRILRYPIVLGEITLIPLTQGKVAVIDTVDLDKVEGRNWYARAGHKTFYAQTHLDDGAVADLHRYLLDPGDGIETDHRDGNGLNCTRENLRPATKAQNLHNRGAQSNNKSGHKGVYWAAHASMWRARIMVRGVTICLGYHHEIGDAARAYREAASLHHGEYARV